VARVDQSSVSSIFVCPRCGKPIPHVSGYADWCACGHGIAPREADACRAAGRERLAIGERAERRLVEDLARPGAVAAPAPAPARALVCLAVAVRLAWLGPILAGAAVLAVGGLGPVAVAVAALLVAFGVAILVAGSGRAEAPEGVPVTRAAAPALWQLADDVAGALGAPAPSALQVDDGLGARLGRHGRRRQPVLVLGLPFLALLEPGERVALVARTLADGVAGDPLRRPLVAAALARAERLARRLAPLAPLAAVAAHAAAGLRALALPATHRAAYRADVLAAGVVGRAAFVDLLDLRHLADGSERVVDRAAGAGGPAGAVFAALRAWSSAAPAREFERIHRVERLPGSCLGADEPPTACRLELLRRLPDSPPALVLDAARAAALEHDLRGLEPLVEPAVLDAARRRSRAAAGARDLAR
jgi:hypothetical protein